MLGNMMNEQLLISGVLEHAIKNNANTEIVSNTVEGGIHRYTIKDSAKRSKKLANALLNLSIKEGDIIATMAVNSYRHLELYFGNWADKPEKSTYFIFVGTLIRRS